VGGEETMKPIFIFDLDGTLADCSHRLHFIQGERKDWRAFFAACVDDKPIEPAIRTLQALRNGGADIWIWTGRSDEVRYETEQWLEKHGCFRSPRLWPPRGEHLRMRRQGDHRGDDTLKREWLSEAEQFAKQEYVRLTAVFEDRDRVVQMWRAAGLPCFQVADGAY
jgi:phosphoglycolate phosphatase-like HAD superfamily hydrolase